MRDVAPQKPRAVYLSFKQEMKRNDMRLYEDIGINKNGCANFNNKHWIISELIKLECGRKFRSRRQITINSNDQALTIAVDKCQK